MQAFRDFLHGQSFVGEPDDARAFHHSLFTGSFASPFAQGGFFFCAESNPGGRTWLPSPRILPAYRIDGCATV